MPASKLLMLQQNHIKDSTLASITLNTTTASAYMNGQQNGSTKVVLVSSEPMDIEHNRNGLSQSATVNNGTDEELTSLTWLHDKNLIKGINNISCPPNIKHINNNHLKIVSDNAAAVAAAAVLKSQTQLTSVHSKASSSGTVTPNSDLIDDSGVSEDNASTATSSSEHGSIYSRPKALLTAAREIEIDDSDNNNSHTINNKNRANLQHLHQFNHHQPPPASSIIHLSPGGSTVIDTNGSTIHTTNRIITTKSNTELNGNAIKSASTSQITNAQQSLVTTTASGTSTPHTHFHKKYIKAMNALNGYGTDSTLAVVVTSAPTSNSNSTNSSPIAITTNSPTIYSISMKAADYR